MAKYSKFSQCVNDYPNLNGLVRSYKLRMSAFAIFKFTSGDVKTPLQRNILRRAGI
ncbi:hypothetical protein [Emticicia sp. SJ17W-69]|uniref:hypothetical protein n=1 Tax=Emticicia sp. SJ17W-69 TaxID=3421657 RepID=UPI003EBB370B